MSRWLRLYADAMRNPKVIRLSDKDFRLWVRLLAVASENDGKIDGLDNLKHVLSMRLDHLSSSVDRLIKGGLIDVLEGGYEPHNWKKFQYKSDTSTKRVTAHRSKRNVSVTPPDTETETEVPLPKGNGAKPDPKKEFWDTATGYLGTKSRGMIGQWCKAHGQPETARAITESMLAGPPDPVAYINGIFRKTASNGYGPGHSGIPI